MASAKIPMLLTSRASMHLKPYRRKRVLSSARNACIVLASRTRSIVSENCVFGSEWRVMQYLFVRARDACQRIKNFDKASPLSGSIRADRSGVYEDAGGVCG